MTRALNRLDQADNAALVLTNRGRELLHRIAAYAAEDADGPAGYAVMGGH